MLTITDKARDYIQVKGGAVYLFTLRKASLC